jgi:hypothetical protein
VKFLIGEPEWVGQIISIMIENLISKLISNKHNIFKINIPTIQLISKLNKNANKANEIDKWLFST